MTIGLQQQIFTLRGSASLHAMSSPDGPAETALCDLYNRLLEAAKKRAGDSNDVVWPSAISIDGHGQTRTTWGNLEALSQQLYAIMGN